MSVVTTEEAGGLLAVFRSTAYRRQGLGGSPSEKVALIGLDIRLHPFVCLPSFQGELGANSDSLSPKEKEVVGTIGIEG